MVAKNAIDRDLELVGEMPASTPLPAILEVVECCRSLIPPSANELDVEPTPRKAPTKGPIGVGAGMTTQIS